MNLTIEDLQVLRTHARRGLNGSWSENSPIGKALRHLDVDVQELYSIYQDATVTLDGRRIDPSRPDMALNGEREKDRGWGLRIWTDNMNDNYLENCDIRILRQFGSNPDGSLATFDGPGQFDFQPAVLDIYEP